MTEKLNIGVIGAGRIGRLHAEHLAYRVPGVNLVAISDIIVSAAEQVAAKLQIPAAYQDHRRIMDDPAIQAVVDLLQHRHPLADDRRGRSGRQAHLLRKAYRL